MPFPLSPVNGQQTTLNGVTYEYSSSNGTWTKIPATVVPSIDQVARDKANSASSNTIYTQGVDTTQNTRIQAAFDKANNASPMLKVASINSSNVYSNIVSNVSTIAFDSFTGFHVDDMGEGNVKISLGSTFSTWNVVGQGDLNAVGDDIIRINGANGIVITTNPSDTPYKSITFNGKTIFDKANSAYNMAEAADILAAKLAEVNLTQNTSIQAAFDKANSANVLAQAAFNAANAASSSVDQYARDTANSASSNTIYTQGVDVTQNTRITAVDAFAQSAYNKANTGGEYAIDNVARLTANAAFDKANSANVLAQAAFNAANAASSFSFDQYARDTANSASSNTIVLQGVNLTQNTNITAVNNFASGAYNKANSADDLAQSAFNKANSSNVLAQASFNTANTKLNSSGGTISGDLTVTGNLFVSGNTSSYTSNNVVINDPIILLANNNFGNSLDIGFVGHYIENDILKHTGLLKDVSANTWYLFDNYGPHLQETNVIDPNEASLKIATLRANLISNSVFISGYDALAYTQASFNKANTAASDIAIIQGVDVTQNTRITAVDSFAGGAYNQANTAAADITVIQGVNTTQNTRITAVDSYAGGAYAQANAANNLAQSAFNKANTGAALNGFLSTSVLVANSTGYIANSDLRFYSSNNALVSPGDIVSNGYLKSLSSSGDEGGEIFLARSQANTTLDGGITIDSYQNKIRFFEQGGSARGAYIDLTECAGGAGTNLLSGGGGTLDQYARDVNVYQNTRITAVDSFVQASFDKANSANSLAQAAFNQANTGGGSTLDQYARDTANSASSNTIVIQGVNVWQNTNITNADTKAQAAFDKSNSANILAQAAFEQANLALTTAVAVGDSVTIIQGVNLTQNTNITHADTKAQAAFDKANTASSNTIVIQGVDDWQNTRITAIDSFVTGSFNKSNSAFDKANSANVLAQAAFNQANTASSNTIYTQGVDTTQNTRLTSVETLAQAAFNQANTGGGGSSNSFATISVAGQSNVVADSSTDTLTLVAGSGISITTNESTDTITITSTGGGGGGGGIINDLSTTLSISSGSVTLNVAAYSIFSVTLNESISSINITDVSSAPYISNFVLVVTYNGTEYNITWPESFRWADGVAPSLTTTNGKKDIFTFFTLDGGTTYNAIIAGLNV
jgi:hypothetical protein